MTVSLAKAFLDQIRKILIACDEELDAVGYSHLHHLRKTIWTLVNELTLLVKEED